jgi:Spy/CpxP family protein refolding chaperone
MKSPIILCIPVVALMLASTAWSQQGQGKGHGRPSLDERVARLSQELDLSDEQAMQVRDIMSDAQASRPNVRIMDREEARPALCRHMLETDARIKAVLSESQVEQYDVFKESRKAGMGGGRGRGPVDCSEFEETEAETAG